MATPHSNLVVRCGRRALATSIALHMGVVGLLVIDAWLPFLALLTPPKVAHNNHVILEAREASAPDWSEDHVTHCPIAPRNDDNPLLPSELYREPDEVFGNRTIAAVEKMAIEAQAKDGETNLRQLDQLAGELGRISSEKSVDEMAGKFRQWLGTRERADRPAEKPIAGEFDYATAQLHDVRREAAPEGGHAYFAVLVDAEGRRFESRMEAVEGESAYKTMQLMKANPLAEMVYRRIVMGFLDNVIKAGKAAQEIQEQQEAKAAKPQAAEELKRSP